MITSHLRRKMMLAAMPIVLSCMFNTPSTYAPGSSREQARLPGHIPERAIAAAEWHGRLAGRHEMAMSFVLPLRDQDQLEELLGRLHNPADPLYGHYLSPQEFTERFGPTEEDYEALAGYARSLGLRVTGTHPNRLLLDVSGPAASVEAGFNLQMSQYMGQNGREFYAPDDEPEVPAFVASRIVGIAGLENANLRQPHIHYRTAADASGNRIGTGPGGGLSPRDIWRAYNLDGVAAEGSGETLALFELDGYRPSDIDAYLSYYGLPSVTLENVLVDGYSGRAGSGAAEVTLDIELQIAVAPGASRILVYEGPNSDTGVLHTYSRIATDNLARQVSTSWGLSELQSSAVTLNAECSIFAQMAAQGQTIYAASGDNGAYDNGAALSVDDPASQPYVIATGGTRLFLDADAGYEYETTWNTDNTVRGGASGGGFSSIWPTPFWQRDYVPAGSGASTDWRNVPDVSLNADPQTGYSIFYRSRWYVYGGTSCVAPIWAAFNARVNQQRILDGLPPLGFAAQSIYLIASGDRYRADFHDVADGSTNLFYGAGAGYDNATGWGSFNAANLFADLSRLGSASSSEDSVRYYNALGQPYTNEDVAYWQTDDGKWWMGDKTGKITPVTTPPWF